ncbi:MAG: DUF5615 family PIN-like protein [Nitrospirae bacterium]|nr:DUF5615 family PIN-like protein [Nitrospirota bacterium]MCL5977129.1 DUF5615 family PIN-like protein [Nitrospirota bacterium]
MNFFADEGIDRQIVDSLREEGYSVNYVAEMEPGISDDYVLELANRERAILLTADKDFGELVFRMKKLAIGIVLVRLAGLSPAKKAEIVVNIINQHLQELSEAFSVITPTGIRIRHQRI